MEKRGRGRPEVKLTKAQIDKAAELYADGLSLDLVAEYIGCSTPTLKRECGDRLVRAKSDFLQRVMQVAGKKALKGNERMIDLILTTQARWSKTEHVDVTSGGEPLQIVVTRRTLARDDS